VGLGRLLTRQQESAAEQHRAAGATFETILMDAAAAGGGQVMQPYRGGMRVPGAWRCAVVLSDLLGMVPWNAYREYGGNPVEQIKPRPWLLEQPNPPDTRMTSFSSWALDLIWEGNAIGIVAARNATGYPTAAYAVPAAAVGVRRITDQSWSTLPIGTIEYSVGQKTFPSSDIIHIKGPCEPGALRGIGVLEAHMATLNLAKEQSRQAGALAVHGVPTGVIESANPDLTSDEAKDIKAKWLQSQRDRTIAVLNATTTFKPLSWNPEELQLVEARKFSLHELALIFGVPLSLLGVESGSRTYSNIEQEGINLLKFSLGGHLARFEQTLSQHMARGTWAQANLDAILRADTLTRYQAHKIGLGGKPFLTVEEVRAIEDRGPMPASDTPAEPTAIDQPDDPFTDPEGAQTSE
jgi:HK97 family phage portal protein